MKTRYEYNKTYREKHKDRLKIVKAEYDKKYNAENKDKKVLNGIKQRAKDNNLDFDLTLDDINNFSVCPVFGFVLERSKGKPAFNSPSVDRIDPTKGYTKDNIQILSNKANTMKQDATKEELVAFAKWILQTYGENE